MAEHRGVAQRHVYPDLVAAQHAGDHLQPDEQSELPDLPPDYSTLGINVYNDETPQWFFNVSGYFGINSGDTNTFLRNEFQIVDTMRWTRGSHELAAGVDYSYGQGDIVNNFRANGRFTFSNAAPFTSDALTDFFLGKFSSFEQGIGEYKNTRMHFFAAFAHDTFRVSRQLTLNLGLRWDPFIPYTDVNDRLACYRPGQKSQVYVKAPTGMAYPGDPACSKGGYDTSWTDFGPRFSLAYDPFGDGRTSVRAGYGVFYDRPNTISTNSPANQGPFGTVVSFPGDAVNSVAIPYAGRINPFPADPFNVPQDAAFFLPHTAFSYDEHLRNGRLQSWNVTAERELFSTYLLRVGYAGSHGDRLAMGRELNAAVYAPGATTATTNQRRPLFPDFGSIVSIESTGRSDYNALQLTLEKRMARGFTVLSSYTLSKTMDHAGENKQTGDQPLRPRFRPGVHESDRRHRWVTSFLWNLPGRFDNALAAAVLSDWRLAGIVTMHSGNGFSVTSGVDNARTGTGSQRADITGDPELPDDRPNQDKVLRWFDTTVTRRMRLAPSATRSGTPCAVRDTRTSILACTRPLRPAGTRSSRSVSARFNVFNWVNLGTPVTAQNSGNFGRITTALDPRIMQLAVRWQF